MALVFFQVEGQVFALEKIELQESSSEKKVVRIQKPIESFGHSEGK
jgi:hypothetical protein